MLAKAEQVYKIGYENDKVKQQKYQNFVNAEAKQSHEQRAKPQKGEEQKEGEEDPTKLTSTAYRISELISSKQKDL